MTVKKNMPVAEREGGSGGLPTANCYKKNVKGAAKSNYSYTILWLKIIPVSKAWETIAWGKGG